MCLIDEHTLASDFSFPIKADPFFKENLSSPNLEQPAFTVNHSVYSGLLNHIGNPCDNCSLQIENSNLRSEKGYWMAMHQKAVQREATLKEEIAELRAKVNLRERQLFGRKSEKGGKKSESKENKGEKRPRGQQPGSKGHGRRDYSHLPAKAEFHDLPKDQCYFQIAALLSNYFLVRKILN